MRFIKTNQKTEFQLLQHELYAFITPKNLQSPKSYFLPSHCYFFRGMKCLTLNIQLAQLKYCSPTLLFWMFVPILSSPNMKKKELLILFPRQMKLFQLLEVHNRLTLWFQQPEGCRKNEIEDSCAYPNSKLLLTISF